MANMGRASGGLQAELAERPEGVDTQATDRYQRPWQGPRAVGSIGVSSLMLFHVVCAAVMITGAHSLPRQHTSGHVPPTRGPWTTMSVVLPTPHRPVSPLRGGAPSANPPIPPKPAASAEAQEGTQHERGEGAAQVQLLQQPSPTEGQASYSFSEGLGCASASRVSSIYQERRRKSISWQPSASSDLHDDVNLVALFALGFGAVAALALGQPHHSFHTLLTYTGFIYILLDSVWILRDPKIVKSPGMVGAHHFATLLVLLDPLLHRTHRVYTSACLLVEINTLLLLLRRKLSYSYVVEAPFILTWILLRNVWYPLLLLYFVLCFSPTLVGPLLPASMHWLLALRQQIEGPTPSNMMLPAMLSWGFVCVFQFYWSYQLFSTHPWIWGKKKPAALDANGKNKRYL